MIEGKLWGTTRTLQANAVFSLHAAEVKAGFRCSRHLHRHKHNGFLVVSGQLSVRVWPEGGPAGGDVTALGPGDWTDVPPGVWHRFECQADTLLIEAYWPAGVDGADIVRADIGGTL